MGAFRSHITQGQNIDEQIIFSNTLRVRLEHTLRAQDTTSYYLLTPYPLRLTDQANKKHSLNRSVEI